jgi:hypothetical protein
MLAELTGFTSGRWLFGGTELEVADGLAERVAARMSEALVPEHHGWSSRSEGLRHRGCQRVEVTGAITSEDHRTSGKVLNRETERIKLNGNVIVMSKGTN